MCAAKVSAIRADRSLSHHKRKVALYLSQGKVDRSGRTLREAKRKLREIQHSANSVWTEVLNKSKRRRRLFAPKQARATPELGQVTRRLQLHLRRIFKEDMRSAKPLSHFWRLAIFLAAVF